jgi:AraC-like DNA-binding protein
MLGYPLLPTAWNLERIVQDTVSLAITFALSQVVLSALLLLRSKTPTVQQRLYAVLLVAITAYLLTPATRGMALHSWMGGISTAVPGMFWLFSASLFDDHFRLRPWQLALVSLTVLPPALASLLWLADWHMMDWLLVTLPQLLEFALLGLTLVVVVSYWQVDLIESRRSLRLWFCSLNGVYIFALLFTREVIVPELAWLDPLQYVPVGGILLATNALLLEYKSGIFGPARLATVPAGVVEQPEKSEEIPPVVSVSGETLARIRQLMEEELIFKEESLTIGQLATRLALPAYRLRKIINSGLGFRNFNDFLNSYRVEEAARLLADPAKGDLQILNIAQESGFRSLSSFNKAFKETYQMTPRSYRGQGDPQS